MFRLNNNGYLPMVSYQKLKPAAMKLGSAFQKINFLRDIREDFKTLSRVYFPNVDMSKFSQKLKSEIKKDIEADFACALEGIRELPLIARFGVYVAYVYYYALFTKIKKNSLMSYYG